jgi:GNAT superfamily N-acetyltransferase
VSASDDRRAQPEGPDRPRRDVVLRDATPADLPEVLRLIRALAAYERLEHRCVAQEHDLQRVLFGPRPYGQAMLAEAGGRAMGLALWHTTLSTFTCRPGYWLEDIFVEEAARGMGIGKLIFAELARRLAAEGGHAIAWRVLKWNAPSIAFYRSLGAQGDPDEWDELSLSGDALARLTA